VFGEVADTYDRRRPSYPAHLIDAILAFAGLDDDLTTPVAEVGAGTGKASVLFAARGRTLTCIEPSPAMAAIARRNLTPFRQALVLQTSFEDWQPESHGYGLLYAAQSWHWVSPEVRYVKASSTLSPAGTLALFWNVIVSRGSESLDRALSEAYGDLIPNAMWRPVPAERIQANDWAARELEDCDLFGAVTMLREPWHAAYDKDAWLELLSTQSDHRMLDEDDRKALFDRIGEAVDDSGGTVEVEYISVAYLAQVTNQAERSSA